MIDAHQHFWRLGRNDCAWPPSTLCAIHRDFAPGDLISLAAPLGVRGSILVQSQPSDRDTDYLLDLAQDEDFVRGVVGWADLASPAAPARIADLAARPKLKGLRPMLESQDPDHWILSPILAPAISALVDHGLSLDALIAPRHLPHLRVLAQRWPGLRLVVDHAAKPDISGGGLEPWRTDLAVLADLPQVYCKLSGLLTQAPAGAGVDALRPYVDPLLELFGPERLMWGSDWPVLNLAGGYAEWLQTALDMVHSLGEDGSSWVFRRTAEQFYRL